MQTFKEICAYFLHTMMTSTVTCRGQVPTLHQSPLQQTSSVTYQTSLDDLLLGISECDAEALQRLSQAIEERRYSLGIGRFCQARIYLVRALDTGIVAYVGSTTRSLKTRWSGHESFFKVSPQSKWSAYVLAHGGPQNFEIELVEDYPCRSLQELLEREKHFIHVLDPVCNIAMRTEESGSVLDASEDVVSNEKECAKKFIRPLASFRDDCRSYEMLHDINADTCRTILNNNRAKKSNELEVLTAYKHIFDNHLVSAETTFAVRKRVFDLVMRERNCRRIFVNVLLWRNKDCIKRLEDLYGSEHPFRPAFENAGWVLDELKKLVRQLGLESLWDCQSVFSSTTVEERLSTLQPIIKNLVGVMNLTDSSAEDPIKAFTGQMNKVAKLFTGYGVVSQRTQNTIEDGSRKSLYRFSLSLEKGYPAVSADFFASVLDVAMDIR